MIRKPGKRIAALVASVLLAVGARAQQLEPGPMPEPGVLLLRNGHSIHGKITRAGELYYIALPHGEIRVKATDVELYCRNLEEGYLRKRALIGSADVGDHIQLAQWCLRHKLLDQADEELADARHSDSRHPMIGILQRRLELAREPPRPPAPPDQPIDTPPPSMEDLQRLVRGMPAGSVETFTRQVQPVLIHNCTAVGCHGPATTTRFRLLRIPAVGPPSRLVTQRNLQATLPWVDRQQPAASPLLTAPIRPHGTAKTAVFTHQQITQYKRLVDWVHQVAQHPQSEVPATVVPREKPPVRAMSAERYESGFSLPQQSPTTQPPLSKPDIRDPFAETPLTPPESLMPPESPESPKAEFVPIDPFDPEIFNRRYF